MKTRIQVALIMLLTLVNIVFSRANVEKSQIYALDALKAKYQNNIKVNWNESIGTPDIITFQTPVHFSDNREESLKEFLTEMQPLINYRIKLDTLLNFKQKEHKGRQYFHYQQKYKGVPVKGGEYVVTVSESGGIRTALGYFYTDINLNTNPGIDISEIVNIALKNPPKGVDLDIHVYSNELIIYPKDDQYFLAYELHIRDANNESWCYIIDAQNGSVIESKSNLIFTSYANVYPRHPYLDASYSQISPVAHLLQNGYLQGTYAYIGNDETTVAYNASDDFRYLPSNTHFDEANLYYHVDRYRANYLNNLGFNEFTQIEAYAHHDFYDGGTPSPNACYDSDTHYLLFSDGQGVAGFNSFAKEDKIIYHEYTHAVTDYVADLYYGFTESGAIHEGNSDYFAASFTGRVLIGEYACPSYQRDITDPYYDDYSEYTGDPLHPNIEPHDGGELWSACLWDLRGEVSTATSLVRPPQAVKLSF